MFSGAPFSPPFIGMLPQWYQVMCHAQRSILTLVIYSCEQIPGVMPNLPFLGKGSAGDRLRGMGTNLSISDVSSPSFGTHKLGIPPGWADLSPPAQPTAAHGDSRTAHLIPPPNQHSFLFPRNPKKTIRQIFWINENQKDLCSSSQARTLSTAHTENASHKQIPSSHRSAFVAF